MKKNAIGFLAALLVVALLSASCTKQQSQVIPSSSPVAGTNLKSDKGSESAREVYYDDELVVVNMAELSEQAAENLIANNAAVNEIYASNDLDEEQDFLSVIDAIPGEGEGFNPLWLQFLIVFNDGFTPHQFTSEEDVEAAADAGEITLVNTGEIYRCSVIGVSPN